ncbi:Inosose isomerase [Gammaproteobacteria bacterium]|nr:Inosose isomerase [Gammaproteobacteria bacterium]
MSSPELLASCWTTAGAVGPQSASKKSPEAFRDRVQAAPAAGFVGIGLNYDDLVTVRDTIGFQGVKTIMARFEIKHIELEMLLGWYDQGSARERADQVCRDVFEGASSLDAVHVKARCDYSQLGRPFADIVSEFRTLCYRAADANTKVAFEPQPMSALQTPGDAFRLIDAAGHDAAGILIDIWHLHRSGASLESLRNIPVDKIFAVELNDAASEVVGTLAQDTVNNRRFCGEGNFDVRGFIKTLQTLGYDRLWGVEIISASVREMPMREAVNRAFQTTSAQFQKFD